MQETDVAVIGAGISGIAAAVTAARSGCRTLLIEKSSSPGGIAVKGNINTICGLFIDRSGESPEMLYKGFPEEFARRLMREDGIDSPVKMGKAQVLLCRTESFEKTIHTVLKNQENLSVQYSTSFSNLRLKDNCIDRIETIVNDRNEKIRIGAVVDCSGNADVCRSAGAPVLAPDERNQVPALIFPLIHIVSPGYTPLMSARVQMVLKRAVNSGHLPKGAETVTLHPTLEKNAVTIKLNLGRFMKGSSSDTDMVLDERANRLKDDLVKFLQSAMDIFQTSKIPEKTYPVVHRDGIKAKGVYILAGTDVLNGRKFTDAATKGCWPVEKWDISGNPNIQYLPHGEHYDIPERALRVPGIKNLMIAGKCISADNDAIASARVIGCCLATGEAAAKLAVHFLSAPAR